MAEEDRKKRIEKLIDHISNGLHERQEPVAVSLLAALSGQNIFLLGPPGTAKSMLARRLKLAFAKESQYFEYLMQRFSTPEEVFGPVSLAELKKDNYVRKTKGFLPEADIAFLDEIWKSSPAILNTLLTIINEKTFRNGTEIKTVPLKALIAASNETPPPKQGLEALYDRFIVRLHVPPMRQENLERLLTDTPSEGVVDCDFLAVEEKELKVWREEIARVKLSSETIQIIKDIRLQLTGGSEKNSAINHDSSVTGDDKGSKTITKESELNIYVSDRRWQKAAMLLKAAAYFCGRECTNLADALLLRHCLWTTDDDREAVIKIVENAVEKCGFVTDISSQRIVEARDALEQKVKHKRFYNEDSYKIVESRGNKYHKTTIYYFDNRYPEPTSLADCEKRKIYIPLDKRKTDEEFYPVDRYGDSVESIICWFDKQNRCYAKSSSYYSLYDSRSKNKKGKAVDELPIKPEVSICKGTKRDINPKLLNVWRENVNKLYQEFDNLIEEIERKKYAFAQEIDTPFVIEDVRNIALCGIDDQIDMHKRAKKSCDIISGWISE